MTWRTFNPSLLLPLTATLLCGAGLHCDKQITGTTDLAMSADLTIAADLMTPPADLSPPADLTPPTDLAGTPGDRCLIALPLPTDNTARSGTNSGFSDDYQFVNTATVCKDLAGSSYKGRDVAYAVTVPAGKTLTVTLTPNLLNGPWYPMLALVSDCAMPGPSCLGGQDTVTPNSKDRVVTYQNAGATDRNLFVLVDTFDVTGTGPYTIKAALN